MIINLAKLSKINIARNIIMKLKIEINKIILQVLSIKIKIKEILKNLILRKK